MERCDTGGIVISLPTESRDMVETRNSWIWAPVPSGLVGAEKTVQ